MPNELFLTTNQKTKIRNTFNKITSTDAKLSKAQLNKIIQSGGFFGKTLDKVIDNLDKKALIGLAVPLTKDVLLKLGTKATSSVLDKFERKISGQGAVTGGKGFTLFISNSLEKSLEN